MKIKKFIKKLLSRFIILSTIGSVVLFIYALCETAKESDKRFNII